MDSRTVLILGAGGYIGSVLTPYLRGKGLGVTAIDNGQRPGAKVGCDPRSFQQLSFDELARFESIILLAGHSSVSACDREPRASFANNVDSFIDLVHKLRGQRLLFASSISIYIRTPDGPAHEEQPFSAPVSFYDLHKQVLEEYVRIAYPNSYPLRFGTLCGPSPNIRLDLLINSLVWSALTRKRLEVANRGYHRPILGINDLCRAVEAILTRSVPPGPYNLASANVRIGEVADAVASRLKVPCVEVERPTLYDIEVLTDKFRSAANFEFTDTVNGLIDELVVALTPRVATAG